jgi:anti-sigma B factor antagonist
MPSPKPNPSRELSIRVTHSDAGARVSLSGRLSIDTSPELRDRLLAILGQKLQSAVMIEMAELSYIDCSGVATLLESLKIARSSNTMLLFSGLRDRPRYLLEVAGLIYLFQTGSSSGHSSVLEAS